MPPPEPPLPPSGKNEEEPVEAPELTSKAGAPLPPPEVAAVRGDEDEHPEPAAPASSTGDATPATSVPPAAAAKPDAETIRFGDGLHGAGRLSDHRTLWGSSFFMFFSGIHTGQNYRNCYLVGPGASRPHSRRRHHGQNADRSERRGRTGKRSRSRD